MYFALGVETKNFKVIHTNKKKASGEQLLFNIFYIKEEENIAFGVMVCPLQTLVDRYCVNSGETFMMT